MSPRVLSEPGRLARLHQLGILDTRDDRYFRTFAERALALLPGTAIAAVSMIDAERQWFKAIVGTDVRETPRDISFCTHTIQGSGVMVVEDATQDARFAENPMVTRPPGIRFYAGVKLMDGIGTLCVLGLQPRRTTERELGKLAKLAQFADIQILAHGALHQLRRTGPSIQAADVSSHPTPQRSAEGLTSPDFSKSAVAPPCPPIALHARVYGVVNEYRIK